ncbi:MAG TPA: hypothetical protein VN175_11880 [Rhizomicrobium sp.]|nr:hypothetical protein [Rhizomicrobium sp.]
MIFRAVFWIGLVSLLAPHEPDLGLGRPGAGAALSSPDTLQPAANGLSRNGTDCGSACAGALLSVFHLNNTGLARGLADVKAQIHQAQRERAAPVKAI